MSDKRIGIEIQTNAKSAKTEINNVSTAIKSMTANLKKTGYSITNIRVLKNGMGEYKKAVITAKNGTETLRQTINKLGKTTGIQTVTKQAQSAKSAISQMFNFGKLYAFWNTTARIRTAIKNMVVSAIDFVETTNKFEVSMDKMEDSAYKFIDTVSERFGLAKEQLMNYQSTYNNIMKSLSGITDETAYKISESITKMAIDYASLYNVSTEESMTKFQSALVGSVRPIRSESGYDITETTIGEKAKELGVTKAVRQLSQMEKRLLRIMVLMDQMKQTGAMGDFARTIEQPANQLKVLQNQLKELGVWLGNVFLETLGRILPYINGFVMALKEMAKLLAIFVGYTNPGVIADPLQDASDSTEDMADNLGSAVGSAKELRKTLMGFDVLNVITTPKQSSGGSGVDTSVDPKILAALKQYDNLMENVRMKATEIRNKILEWLGFTWDLDEAGNMVNLRLEDGYTNLEKIIDALKIAGVVISTLFVLKILDGISKIILAFTSFEGFKTMFPALGKVMGAVFEKIKTFIVTIGVDKFMSIVTKVVGAVAGIAITIKGIIGYVKDLKQGMVDIDTAMGHVIEVVGGIALAVGVVLGLIPGLIAGLVAAIGTLIYTLVTKWEEFTVGLKAIWQYAVDWLEGKWEAFTVGVQYLWDSAWNGIKNGVNKLKEGFVGAWNGIKSAVGSVIDWIKSKWEGFKKIFTLPQIKLPHFTWSTTPATGWIKTVLDALSIPASLPKLSVSWYAKGGMPDVGELFVAREAGPELVGNIGSKSAVVNNEQIVEAVSQGVAQAVSSVMGANGGNYNIYIDGQQITDVVTKRINRMANITGGGYVYG